MIDQGISIKSSASLSSDIFTSLLVSSPKQQSNPTDDNIFLNINASEYKVIRKNGFWRCSRFAAKAAILDSPSPASLLSLELFTLTGDIQMEAFQSRNFGELKMRAPNGIVTVGGVKVQTLLSVRAAGEGIGIFHSFVGRLEILGDQTGISLGNTSASIYSVQTKQGSILSSNVFLSSSSSSCEAQFFTSQGAIQLQLLTLDPHSSIPCKISVAAKRGDITIKLANFSGKYSIQSSSGSAKVNTKACEGGLCTGTVTKEGPEHELVVMNKAGDISVSFD